MATQKPTNNQHVSKRPRDADSDDTSEVEQTNHGQNMSSSCQLTPRFLVITSKEEKQVASLSPFVIEKVLKGIAGIPKSIKKLRSGDLLVEYDKQSQIENLLRTEKFFDLKVKCSLHGSLNTSKGVVRCFDLKGCSDQEILENMREQGVIAVRRIKVRRDRILKDTNTFVFTFNTPVLPKQLKVAFLRVSVDVYIPNPLRCYQCQLFGHHEDRCNKTTVCANCGEPEHCSDAKNCTNTAKCVNCSGNHPSNARECQAWNKEKEILKIKYTRNISFPEARKIIEAQTPIPGRSYASITKTAGVTVSCVDAQTQTDPVFMVDPPKTSSYNVTSTDTSSEPVSMIGKIKADILAENKAKNKSPNAPGPKPTAKEILSNKAKNKSSNAPGPKPTAKEKKKLDSGRQPKGSQDPIKLHNKYDSLEDDMDAEESAPSHMDAEESAPSLPKGTLSRVPTSRK
ncbi:MAG: hypothetical protein KZQ86_01700 [Candidatus Thiodiazotropha sp. (ex Lucinoma kastoroae)]|nr:hypothetical protein [Candidatus Thiodiazotropha sp. (ex Lucinoma kastoroae)]